MPRARGVRDLIRPGIVRTVQSWAAGVGLEVKRTNPALPPQDVRRTRIIRRIGAGVVLDVGANAGQYAHRLRGAGYAQRIVSFEPLSGPYSELERRAAGDERWVTFQLALGSTAATSDIHVAANFTSSSFLEMDQRVQRAAPEAKYVGTERVQQMRLDAVDGLLRAGDRAFLKLDVQGYELEVLRGATQVLENIWGIEAELSLIPHYHGAPGFRELLEYIEALGFSPVGFDPVFVEPESGFTLAADGVFVRDSEAASHEGPSQ